ncbi:MAG: hypothetical protein HRF49_01175 [bacterium]
MTSEMQAADFVSRTQVKQGTCSIIYAAAPIMPGTKPGEWTFFISFQVPVPNESRMYALRTAFIAANLNSGALRRIPLSINELGGKFINDFEGALEWPVYSPLDRKTYAIFSESLFGSTNSGDSIGVLASITADGKLESVDKAAARADEYYYFYYKPVIASDGALWYVRVNQASKGKSDRFELVRYDPVTEEKRVIHRAARFGAILVKPEKEW